MSRRILPHAAPVVLLLAFSASAAAQTGGMADFLARSTQLGALAGVAYPGCTYVDDSDCFDSDVNWSLGGFVDYRLGEKFLGGVYLDIDGASGEGSEDSDVLFDVGLALKGQIASPTSSIAWRPGIAFGAGYGVDVAGETSTNLTLRFLLEAVIPTSGRISWIIQGAIWASPAGGNSEVDFTFGPGFILRGGVIF
jgi:hypothetical protein